MVMQKDQPHGWARKDQAVDDPHGAAGVPWTGSHLIATSASDADAAWSRDTDRGLRSVNCHARSTDSVVRRCASSKDT